MLFHFSSLLKDQGPENGLGGKGAIDVGGKQQIIGGEVGQGY